MTNKKNFWESKTKLAGILIALGLVGTALSTGDFNTVIEAVYKGVIVVLGVFGLRDLPIVNK